MSDWEILGVAVQHPRWGVVPMHARWLDVTFWRPVWHEAEMRLQRAIRREERKRARKEGK